MVEIIRVAKRTGSGIELPPYLGSLAPEVRSSNKSRSCYSTPSFQQSSLSSVSATHARGCSSPVVNDKSGSPSLSGSTAFTPRTPNPSTPFWPSSVSQESQGQAQWLAGRTSLPLQSAGRISEKEENGEETQRDEDDLQLKGILRKFEIEQVLVLDK